MGEPHIGGQRDASWLTTDHELTVVIPAYNEQARLPGSLRALAAFLDAEKVDYRVLVADDGSSDHTARVTDPFGPRFSTLTLARHAGKGCAVRTAMLQASGAIVAFTDADLPYDLRAMMQACDWIRANQCDVVLGARDGRTSVVQRRLMRKLATHAFQQVVKRLVGDHLSDTQCGLKLFSRRAALEIFSRAQVDGFAFDAEVVMLALRLGLRCRRVDVTLINEYGSSVSLARDALPMLLDLVRARIRLGRQKVSPQFDANWAHSPGGARRMAA